MGCLESKPRVNSIFDFKGLRLTSLYRYSKDDYYYKKRNKNKTKKKKKDRGDTIAVIRVATFFSSALPDV